MKKTTKNTIGNIDNVLATAASDFANNVLDIVRQAVVGDLMGVHIVPGKPEVQWSRKTAAQMGIPATERAPRASRKRRTAKDVNRALERVVGILNARKEPLGAEHIRAELKVQRKELPRILRAGLESGVLRSAGEKRATRYSLVSASAAPHPAKMAGKGKKA